MADKMLKLYDKVPAESLAALMVGAAFRNDTDEAKALWSAVIKVGNSSRYERYRRRRESLVLVVMLWANECLRTQANMVALSGVIASGEADSKEVLLLDALCRGYRATLAALDAAMAEFAEETGIDLAAIKILAAVDLIAFNDSPVPARSKVDELLDQYRYLLA